MNFLGATLYNILAFETPLYLTEHEAYEMHFHQLFFPGLNQFKRSGSFQQTGLLIIRDGPSISQDCKWNRKPINLCLLKHTQSNQQTKDMRKEMKTENEETWKGRRETDEDQKRRDKKIDRKKEGRCWWAEFKAGGAKWDMPKKQGNEKLRGRIWLRALYMQKQHKLCCVYLNRILQAYTRRRVPRVSNWETNMVPQRSEP